MRRIVIGDNGTGQGRVLADDTVDPLPLALLLLHPLRRRRPEGADAGMTDLLQRPRGRSLG